jgi:hypothetical protein
METRAACVRNLKVLQDSVGQACCATAEISGTGFQPEQGDVAWHRGRQA